MDRVKAESKEGRAARQAGRQAVRQPVSHRRPVSQGVSNEQPTLLTGRIDSE